jgi:hypothetical protein
MAVVIWLQSLIRSRRGDGVKKFFYDFWGYSIHTRTNHDHYFMAFLALSLCRIYSAGPRATFVSAKVAKTTAPPRHPFGISCATPKPRGAQNSYNRRGAKGVIECEGSLRSKPGCGGRDFSALLFPYKRASPRRAKTGLSAKSKKACGSINKIMYVYSPTHTTPNNPPPQAHPHLPSTSPQSPQWCANRSQPVPQHD